ncbi:MAG: Hsp33 family molecular chaperone HslO [Clostridiales bacterium]|nr:Hsp33 family molecular chaperone HslO [Clostridiales bacterium]
MKNLLRTLVFDGQVSLTLADTTEIVREGIKLHKLSPSAAFVFGKALSAMTFMSACLKNEAGEISLSLQGDGLGGEIAVSGNRALRLRGYIHNTDIVGKERDCLGENGSLTIIRDDGYNRPFVGACALPKTGGVDEAFEEYYRISEQLPTYIKTHVDLDENGDCVFAGVAVLQPLPFADEKTLEKVESFNLFSVLEELKTLGAEETARRRFDVSKEVFESRTAVYKCNCSRRYLLRVLVSLGEEQLREIIKDEGAARIHCHYCNTDYEFNEEDADKLFPHS